MTNAEEFQTKGYTIVRGFLDSQSVQTISMYLENALKRYPENNQGGRPGDSSAISYYADPLIETVPPLMTKPLNKRSTLSSHSIKKLPP